MSYDSLGKSQLSISVSIEDKGRNLRGELALSSIASNNWAGKLGYRCCCCEGSERDGEKDDDLATHGRVDFSVGE